MAIDENNICQRLDGAILAQRLRDQLKRQIHEKHQTSTNKPQLAVILVGDDPASEIYVNKKRQACEEVGILSQAFHLPNNTAEAQILEILSKLNADPKVQGILVQLPLPEQIRTDVVLEAIHPSKDVDGFHPYNLGRLAQRNPLLRPSTPKGIMTLLDETQISYKEKHAVIVGASNIVGRPMALELLLAGTTVTVCHRFTKDLGKHVSQADILVAAAGKPGLIQADWIKPGCIGIDVGIHRLDNGKLVGDMDPASNQKCAWLTPVPGGVGPMTVISLLENTWQAYQKQTGLNT